jgi:hypothetical protein
MNGRKVFNFPVGFTCIDTSTTATKVLLMGNAGALDIHAARRIGYT